MNASKKMSLVNRVSALASFPEAPSTSASAVQAERQCVFRIRPFMINNHRYTVHEY